MNPIIGHRAYHDLSVERMEQIKKWGVQDYNGFIWLAILMEEVGEVAKALLEIRELSPAQVRQELVQVAAVAVAWIESIDRRTGPAGPFPTNVPRAEVEEARATADYDSHGGLNP